MLVYPRQPVHLFQPTDLPPSPTPSHSSRSAFFNQLPYTTSTSPSQLNDRFSRSYLESDPSQSTSHLSYLDDSQPSANLDEDTYMTSAYSLHNPAIRIQHPTPVPQLPTGAYSSSLSLSTPTPTSASGVDPQGWGMYGQQQQQQPQSNGHLAASPSLQTPTMRRRDRGHQRGASSSSAGSNGSNTQYATTFPYVAGAEASPSSRSSKIESYTGADEAAQRAFSNHLPTPSQTPTQDSFLATTFPTYTSQPSNVDTSMAAHMALKQALMDHSSTGDDDLPGFGHSARQSVSSYGHDSPATPHTAHSEDIDDKYKLPSNDVMRQSTVPKFNRTMSDIFQDELYNPATVAHMPSQPPSSQPSNVNMTLLSPYRNMVNERLQAADKARSQSPISVVSRDVSPFRQGSQHAPVYDNFNAASAMRQRHRDRSEAFSLAQMSKAEEAEPTTISPKDAMLDYHPTDSDAQMPLFPDSGSADYDTQYASGASPAVASNGTSAQSGLVIGSGPSPPQSSFTFAPPSIPVAFQGLPSFPNTQSYRPAPSMPSAPEQSPEFPAHLTSMDSSASEAGPLDSRSTSSELQKPASTLAETGTYSCTYHGCVLRFDTPQKLQRHKREAHRSATGSVDVGIGSTMTSAALLARNSQAGPHKCERINPTTGKPCNTIFSRPYDLTRHEDTIHNARKQKARCALCVEEKTFSRSDALTRHMRVVHPDVDFPGKHRRRGGNHD